MLLANLLQIIYCNMFFLLASAKWKTKWLFLNIMIIFCCKCMINFRFEFVLGTIMFYKCKKGFNRFSKRRILTDNSVTFRFSLTCFSCKYDQGILVNIFFKFCFLSLASIEEINACLISVSQKMSTKKNPQSWNTELFKYHAIRFIGIWLMSKNPLFTFLSQFLNPVNSSYFPLNRWFL